MLVTTDPVETNSKTADKMSWKAGDVEWTRPQTAAQKLADRIQTAQIPKTK
jgi:hypothetical protein